MSYINEGHTLFIFDFLENKFFEVVSGEVELEQNFPTPGQIIEDGLPEYTKTLKINGTAYYKGDDVKVVNKVQDEQPIAIFVLGQETDSGIDAKLQHILTRGSQ